MKLRHPAAISAIAALAVYAVSLAGTYVYDDRYIVQFDPRIADVHKWAQYWTKDYFYGGADNLYRPLVSMTYAIQAKLHGNDESHAWLFHLVNWLLHAGVTSLVAVLALRMTRSMIAAMVAGLLFAVHPIHVEAVANIVGRAELMCALGVVCALLLFLRPLTNARIIGIWLCFIFALLSKEQAILLPLLLLALAPLAPRNQQRSHVLLLIVLMLWTAAGYLVFREELLKFWWDRRFLDPMINPMVAARGFDRVLVPIAMLGRYVALLVAPWKLSPDYGGTIIGSHVAFADPYLLIGILTATVAIIACVFATVRRAWDVLFCLLAAGMLWALVSNLFVIIGVNFAERLMYLPSVFICILAGIGAMKLPRQGTIVATAIIVALFSIRTITYAWEWNDRLRLYQYASDNWPGSARLQLLLAEEFAERGDLDRASVVIAQACAMQPDYYKVWQRAAVIAMKANRYEDALHFAKRAQDLEPTGPGAQLISELTARIDAMKRAATTPTTAPTRPLR